VDSSSWMNVVFEGFRRDQACLNTACAAVPFVKGTNETFYNQNTCSKYTWLNDEIIIITISNCSYSYNINLQLLF